MFGKWLSLQPVTKEMRTYLWYEQYMIFSTDYIHVYLLSKPTFVVDSKLQNWLVKNQIHI